eukprot:SAG11_NODE_37323_length_257_cov_0.974684_1_plen_36_part_10
MMGGRSSHCRLLWRLAGVGAAGPASAGDGVEPTADA